MGARRSVRIAALLAVIAAAAAAAILLNLALLGYAQPRNDPVGKLSPRAILPAGPPPAAPRPVPATEGEHDD